MSWRGMVMVTGAFTKFLPLETVEHFGLSWQGHRLPL